MKGGMHDNYHFLTNSLFIAHLTAVFTSNPTRNTHIFIKKSDNPAVQHKCTIAQSSSNRESHNS